MRLISFCLQFEGNGTYQGESSVGQASDNAFPKNITICQVQNGELVDVKSTTITLNKSATTKDIKRLLIQESEHFKAVKSECSITLLDCKGLEIENTSATKGNLLLCASSCCHISRYIYNDTFWQICDLSKYPDVS